MVGSATLRFEVGSWKTLWFRETLDKSLQAEVVTAVSFLAYKLALNKVMSKNKNRSQIIRINYDQEISSDNQTCRRILSSNAVDLGNGL